MPIVRSLIQSEETLEEFYQRDSWQGPSKAISLSMLDFVQRVNEFFPKTILFTSTSHQRLCVHQAGEQKLKWVVIVAISPLNEFHISCKLPVAISPWENAWVSGECPSQNEATKMFLKAMKETRFWEGNSELETALGSC